MNYYKDNKNDRSGLTKLKNSLPVFIHDFSPQDICRIKDEMSLRSIGPPSPIPC